MSEFSVQSAQRGVGFGRWLANRPMAVKFLLVVGVAAAVAVGGALPPTKGLTPVRGGAPPPYSDNPPSMSLVGKKRDGGVDKRVPRLHTRAAAGRPAAGE